MGGKPTSQGSTHMIFLCRRGSMLSTAIFVYAATSPVNGYFGGSLYAKQGGDKDLQSTDHILFSLDGLLASFPFKIVTLTQFCLFVWKLQGEDGLSRCSLGPSWSQPWCAALPFSSTSSPCTTTPPEPSHLAPWWVLHCYTSLKTTLLWRTSSESAASVSVRLCCLVGKVIWYKGSVELKWWEQCTKCSVTQL